MFFQCHLVLALTSCLCCSICTKHDFVEFSIFLCGCTPSWAILESSLCSQHTVFTFLYSTHLFPSVSYSPRFYHTFTASGLLILISPQTTPSSLPPQSHQSSTSHLFHPVHAFLSCPFCLPIYFPVCLHHLILELSFTPSRVFPFL